MLMLPTPYFTDHWHMVHTPQKLTVLLYVAAGCTLCKAGFTQQDLTKGLGCLRIVRGLLEDLDNEM